MKRYSLRVVPRSDNLKTGDIPTFWPESRDIAKASCRGCLLLPGPQHDDDEPLCYSHSGRPAMALAAIERGAESSPERYGIDALDKRHPSARAARFGPIGDPADASRRDYKRAESAAREYGLSVLSYTHFWASRGAWLRGRAMASCDTLAQADQAIESGWVPAVHVSSEEFGRFVHTPNQARLAGCPAQRIDGVTCNDCRLCDAQSHAWAAGHIQGIAFRRH